MKSSDIPRTLIDNTSPEGYDMKEVLKACFKDENVTEVCIATGFWDMRGTELVYDELSEFLSRDGSKFRLLIGKDPYLYASDAESFTKSRYDKQEQMVELGFKNCIKCIFARQIGFEELNCTQIVQFFQK